MTGGARGCTASPPGRSLRRPPRRRSGTVLTCPPGRGRREIAPVKHCKPIGFHFVHFELTSRYDHRSEAKYQRAAAGGGGHAHRVKENLTAFFRSEAEQGGASHPDLLARQLSLVFDGASARAGIGADKLTGLVTPTVTTLLDAAGMR
ncbi:hypothetical protein ABT063_14765 [Streptomyces sp. NPDC002838]|uniref:hypothetical protein n=1 Tax=Streptomyces sp. NPDC002838 TaxID=3154436 RepID=UPI0033322B1C